MQVAYVQPQPVMMAQPMMMQQPMMMAPPPQQQAPIIINQGGSGNCPVCEKGNMQPTKKWGCWTCCVCMFCICGLCCDCAWSRGSKCMSCGHQVAV